MAKEFLQINWNAAVAAECAELIRMAIHEDRASGPDLTTVSLVPAEVRGRAAVVARRTGVAAGLRCAQLVCESIDQSIQFTSHVDDGTAVSPGTVVALMEGPAGSLLTAERIVLNFICRLSGIATQSRRFVDAVAGTAARIYDTRKTTPGWRLLEKYAVRQGGAFNHRLGLSEAVLIKDNHLAVGAQSGGCYTPAEAVQIARRYVSDQLAADQAERTLVEVEVDTLEQFQSVLPAGPDIVLLDNMSLDELRAAVDLRDRNFPQVQLEASGTVNLETVAEIARTGVDRISAGALTHGAIWLDFGLDWSA